MTSSSRARARIWLYQRHTAYERVLRQRAAQWFAGRGYAVSTEYAFVLKDLALWQQNIILPEVAAYVE